MLNHQTGKQNQLILDEMLLLQQIEACEAYRSVLFDFTAKDGARFRRTVVESMVFAIHRIELELRTDLCRIQLEKIFTANET